VRDPREGMTPDGLIVTGVDRAHVPAAYEPALADAVRRTGPGESLYVYGSVATGMARVATSDVDLLAVGMAAGRAESLSAGLSAAHAALCREVAVGVAQPADFLGVGDEPYGNRVFLRHYCVWLSGPDLLSGQMPFPADARAARGFNGDIARSLHRWRSLTPRTDPAQLGRRVARKTLFAVSGLVSVHDTTWTTDRLSAARRWGQVHPDLAPGLADLARWSDGRAPADEPALRAALDGVVSTVVAQFDRSVGLWDGPGD
jgi:hypothetical protein